MASPVSSQKAKDSGDAFSPSPRAQAKGTKVGDRRICFNSLRSSSKGVDVMVEFADERRAVAFERYLKSGSGCAFAKRHFRR